ncbi:hypothetical protein [Streptomyces sp. CC228A]|uniref:hypothetical protein n=1 Tax=Streptomyces sp. CC228A TaxID=2898186 RepID=UPI001F1E599F|nr:hypothetical protein [Streptomyces sp. CC228A]
MRGRVRRSPGGHRAGDGRTVRPADGVPATGDPAPPDDTAPPTRAAPPSTGAGGGTADLAAVVLANGDLAEFQITDVPGKVRDTPSGAIRPDACRPVADLRRETYAPAPRALERRHALASRGEHLGTGTQITLAEFAEEDARKIMEGLRGAVRACGNGYTGDGRGTITVSPRDTPDIGEEAVSFHTAGRGVPSTYTVVRRGPHLLRFVATSGKGGDVPVPTPVLVQQVMKLQAATD